MCSSHIPSLVLIINLSSTRSCDLEIVDDRAVLFLQSPFPRATLRSIYLLSAQVSLQSVMRRNLAPIVAAYASLAATQAVTPRTGWTVTADSLQPGNEATNVLDGNTGSIWHTQYTPSNAALPHAITIDMKKIINVNGLTYLPRQDASRNGNIGQHKIEVEMCPIPFCGCANRRPAQFRFKHMDNGRFWNLLR